MASKEQDYVIDKVKEAGKAYKKFAKYQNKDKTKTEADKKNEKKAFFETYRHVMEAYEEQGDRIGKEGENKETGYSNLLPIFGKKEAKEFVTAYYVYINHQDEENENDHNEENPLQNVIDTVDRKSRYAENGPENDVHDVAGGNGEPVEGMIVPRQLTSVQKTNMNKISRWMVRNAAGSDAASSFVLTFIMNQPVRLKLLAYYLIETQSRRATDSLGILNSQGYVPDLDNFKDKMIASKFKFWKRFTGSEIYWDKLGDAMRTALSCKPIMIQMYGSEEMQKEEEFHHQQQGENENPANHGDQEENGNQANNADPVNHEQQDAGNADQEFVPPQDLEQDNEGVQNNNLLHNNMPDNGLGQHNEEEEIREEEEHVEENRNEVHDEAGNEEDEGARLSQEQIRNELHRLDAERSNRLRELLEAIQNYDQAHGDQNAKKKIKEDKKRDGEKRNVLAAFDALVEADKAIETFIKQNDVQRGNIPKASGKSGAIASEGSAWKKTGDYNTNVSQVVGAYKGISKALMQYKVWNLNEDGKLIKGKIDEVLGLATAPVKLINLFLSIKNFSKDTKDMTVAGKICKGLDIINSAAGLASTGITSAHNISKWAAGANFVTDNAAKMSPTVSGTLGVVTGGTQLLTNGVKLCTGLKKSYDISKTRESLEALKAQPAQEQEPLQNQNSDNKFDDTEYEMTGEALEVERRNNTTANSFALVNALSGAANTTAGVLTLTGVGAAAGAILGAIGSGAALASSIAEYFANRRNRIKAIDIYMGIDADDKVNAIGDSIARGMRGSPNRNSVSELETSTLRDTIRNTVMHKKGYMSPESFYSKVCMDYARVIHRGLFKRRGEILGDEAGADAIFEYNKVKDKLSEKEKVYAKMLFNVKLKPRFSKNIDNCTPSAETIATKLKP